MSDSTAERRGASPASSEDSGASLLIRNVSLSRDGRRVLDDLTWTLTPGGVHWVVGENGSGKSTLLTALARDARPLAGAIEARGLGDPVVKLWYRPSMSAPHEAMYRDWLKLARTLAPASSGGALDPEIEPRQRLGAVSTGQHRRALLQMVLSRPASLFLLDEPFEHLSPEGKAGLQRRLDELAVHAVVIVATNQGRATERTGGQFEARTLHLAGDGSWAVS